MAGGDVEALRGKVEKFLKDSGFEFEIDSDRDFLLKLAGFEDEHVWCMPRPWEADEPRTLVLVMAPTNVDMRIDDDLKRFLTEINGRQLFGKFVLNEDVVRIHFVHPVLGDQLNRAELESAIYAVAKGTHRHADEIVERWGGLRFGAAT